MSMRRPREMAAAVARGARWTWRRTLRKPPRILVETRWRLGDEVMAIPIYEAIKRRYPFCHLTVWCNYPDLLLRNPHVDVIAGPEEKPVARDRYILLRGAPRLRRRIEHYAAVAGVPTPQTRPRLYYDNWDSGLREEIPREFIAVCTGATWETKRWPRDKWEMLIGEVSTTLPVVQLGYGDEPLRVDYNLVNQTLIREAACVLRSTRLLISHDTGLMHLALAVGTPVLALFGPTDAALLVQDEKLAVIDNGRACKGCWNRSGEQLTEGVCPLSIAPCMDTIEVDAVLARARELINRGR